MQPFDLDAILTPGLVIFFATLWVAFRMTRSAVFALMAAFVKAGVFLVYFGLLFDGTFTFFDDWGYLEGGREFYAQGIGITNLVDNWDIVLLTGGGDHFGYYIFNTYAFRFFGEGYYAPVAINILLTLLVSWIGSNLVAREFGLGLQRKWFFGFLLLHPDILAWSNIMNGKDILVLLLHVLLLLSCSLFLGGRLAAALALAVPVCIVLFFMRFYVPLLFALALIISLLLARGVKVELRFLFPSVLFTALILVWVGPAGLQYAVDKLSEDFVNPFYGFVRFALTPIPFNTALNYSFLDVPALIHWMLFPFTFWGVIAIQRLHTPFSRFFLVYLLVFISLYSVFAELQGPRHRVQFDFALAILQFIGLKSFLRCHSPRRPQVPMSVSDLSGAP